SKDIAVSKRSTSTTLVCDTPRVIGQASTCTATVADNDTGTISRPDGSTRVTKSLDMRTSDLTSCTLPNSGTNSCSVQYTPTAVGFSTHTTTATICTLSLHDALPIYSKDIAVSKRSTSTTLVCDTPRVIGQASTCTATVADNDTG